MLLFLKVCLLGVRGTTGALPASVFEARPVPNVAGCPRDHTNNQGIRSAPRAIRGDGSLLPGRLVPRGHRRVQYCLAYLPYSESDSPQRCVGHRAEGPPEQFMECADRFALRFVIY